MTASGFDVQGEGRVIFDCPKCGHQCEGATRKEWRAFMENERRAALTADAQPVGDAPRYQPIDAPITGVAAPEPLVYKDADACNQKCGDDPCVRKGEHDMHATESGATWPKWPAQLYSWEQIEAAIRSSDGCLLSESQIADIRARLTPRERVEEKVKDLLWNTENGQDTGLEHNRQIIEAFNRGLAQKEQK
jgi:hypothetical protein